MRRILFGVLSGVVLVLMHGCSLVDANNAAAGASCSEDDDCKSKRCFEGFCGGDRCDLSDSSSSCDSGWKCTHTSADAVSAFFGSNGSTTCKPLCGHCPGNMHCDTTQGAPTPDQLCVNGKPPLDGLTITVKNENQPGTFIVGRPLTFVATAAAGAQPIKECTWQMADGKGEVKSTGPEIENVFLEARSFGIRASCKDEGGRVGSNERTIGIACVPSGEACVIGLCCADSNMRCVRSSSTTGSDNTCRVPTPHEITITGSAIVPVGTEAEYSAVATGGDGNVSRISWTFGESSFSSKEGPSAKYMFSRAGPIDVTASVTTSLGLTTKKTLPVSVCQSDGGRCDKGETCCAPLVCNPGTFARCAPP